MTQAKLPSSLYHARVASGAVVADARQHAALDALDALHTALGKKRLRPGTLRGLYIWGDVGRGKSMLMDLFFECAPVAHKERVHFHAFMQQVHRQLHTLRQAKQGDPVALLVKAMAESTRLLCFDEFHATDVADASLLFRLFEGLFEADVVVVATSNRPPTEVYTGGVQRERFDKFIELLTTRMQVLSLMGDTDYRLRHATPGSYYFPLGPAADAAVEKILERLAPGVSPAPRVLKIQGRALTLTAYGNILTARFSELCEPALGAADYLAIASAFPTVMLTHIPTLTPEKRNEAKRFVTLIDVLYEQKTHLIITAETSAERLYPTGDGAFEFQRTVSRLMEMQTRLNI